jgi:hypothetical protein
MLAARFLEQSEWCQKLGSPLYSDLMRFAAFDVTSGGPSAQILAAFATGPVSLALPLRFMALFHRLALEGNSA